MRAAKWVSIAGSLLLLGFAFWCRVPRKPASLRIKGGDAYPSTAAPNSAASAADAAPLVAASPAAEELDHDALQRLLTRAAAEHSSAVVILRHGKVVIEEYFGQEPGRIAAMSVSKSIASLAIGILLHSRRITSLDDPVARYLPRDGSYASFSDDPAKRGITIQQLLCHTSGLAARNVIPPMSYSIRDTISQLSLQYDPGRVFAYNNQAVDLLSVMIEALTGEHLDAYIQQHIFSPIGITSAQWLADVDGIVPAHGTLSIAPVDLARVGQLLLQNGVWDGRNVIPADWIKRSVAASQDINQLYGLLWWRVPQSRYFGLEPADFALLASYARDASIEPLLQPLQGRHFDSEEDIVHVVSQLIGRERWNSISAQLTRDRVQLGFVHTSGPLRAYEARGWLGQELVIFPDKSIVAVRMRRATSDDYRDGEAVFHAHDSDDAFTHDVLSLATTAPVRTWAVAPPAPASLRDLPPLRPPQVAELGWQVRGGLALQSFWAVDDVLQLRDGHATTRFDADSEVGHANGFWTRRIDATPFRGRSVRFSAFIMTARAPGGVQRLWLASACKHEEVQESGRELPVVSPWTYYTTEIFVPHDALSLEYGLLAGGASGSVWIDGIALSALAPRQ